MASPQQVSKKRKKELKRRKKNALEHLVKTGRITPAEIEYKKTQSHKKGLLPI